MKLKCSHRLTLIQHKQIFIENAIQHEEAWKTHKVELASRIHRETSGELLLTAPRTWTSIPQLIREFT